MIKSGRDVWCDRRRQSRSRNPVAVISPQNPRGSEAYEVATVGRPFRPGNRANAVRKRNVRHVGVPLADDTGRALTQ